MSETTNVWVKSTSLDVAILGSTRVHGVRGLPGTADEDNTDWGWARCVLSSENKTDENGKLEVRVDDEDSNHHGQTAKLPASSMNDGSIVLANKYEGEDDADGGGGYYEVPADPDSIEYPSDLIVLTHLHEPAVVYCLRQRYAQDKIYTATGPILLALNPFKSCKQLYSRTVMQQYRRHGERKMAALRIGTSSSGGGDESSSEQQQQQQLPPHVYGIADESYRIMMRQMEEGPSSSKSKKGRSGGGSSSAAAAAAMSSCDQSILVSGESGAGKTVTTKFIMQYLAALSQQMAFESSRNLKISKEDLLDHTGDKSVEQQVLQSNPILESFGNARTIRNDNSSRFGKFIEIQFTKTGTLVGASIETYLLEKVRLVTQAEGERNYHIFYELFHMDEEELETYYLDDYSPEDFFMTNQSGTYDRRDGVEDDETYGELREAMDTMGMQEGEQRDVHSVTCALLHASNLTFNAVSADESEIDRENEHLEPVLKLLGITADNLNQALCYYNIMAGKEKHTRSLSKERAEKGSRALIKATYGALFSFLVNRVNESITVKEEKSKGGSSRKGSSKKKAGASIGVLDIFGFESFKHNSFEQLCINYCNEALQQQFNLFVLKNEQDEYEREGIKWGFIDFPDNQEVLDLIDKKGSGLLNILDDQCRAPGTTDKTFANDIYKKLTGRPRFEANNRQVGARKFGVVHYAGPVEYDTGGFVEKNRDELPKEATDLLLSSEIPFVKTLAQIISGPADDSSKKSSPGKRTPTRVTVGGQFSRQLQELRKKIDLTSPHYVRCLKPNDQLVPDHFDPLIISDQLRCAGVVEAVRVSRVGYPQRYAHVAFLARYRILGLAALKKAAKLSRRSRPVDVLVSAIAEQIWELEKNDPKNETITEDKKADEIDLVQVGMQVGKTKVFLRRRAYDLLEQLRGNKLGESAVCIQAVARMYLARDEYKRARRGFLRLQCVVRGRIASRMVEQVRQTHNATVIQTSWRRSYARKVYLATAFCARILQRVQRGRVGRKRYDILNRERKSKLIQTCWRRFHWSKHYAAQKKGALILQCAVRSHFAREVLKGLKAESRNLQATSQERDELRKETQRLKKALEEALENAKVEAKKAAESAAAAALGANSAPAADTEEVEKLKKEVEELRADLEEADKDVNAEADRADEAVLKMQELTTQVAELQNDKYTLEALLNDARTESVERDVEMAQLRKEKWDLDAEVAQARADIEEKEAELTRQSDEMEELKSKLEQAEEEPAASPRNLKQQRSDKSSVDSDLEEELEYLRSELENAQNAAEISANTIKDLLEENKELQAEVDEAADFRPSQLPQLAPGEEAPNGVKVMERVVEKVVDPSGELEKAREEIEYLERQLDLARKNLDDGEAVMSDAIAEELYTLQDEVSRLNQELNEARSSMKEDDKSAENLIRRYDELRRLAEAGMEKDREIEALKSELSSIRGGGGGGRGGSRARGDSSGDDVEMEELHLQIEMLKTELERSRKKEPKANGPSLFQRLSNIGDAALSESEVREQNILLKSTNEKLRKEFQEKKKQCSELKEQLREETERSTRELEAFSKTLRGVDELRKAAESMSRELHTLRQQQQTGADPADVDMINEAVPEKDDAICELEHAINILDSAREHQAKSIMVSKKEDGSWFSPRSKGTEDIGKKKKKKKKRRGSGSSVFSSFF